MCRFGGYENKPFLAEFYDFLPRYSERHDIDFYVNLCRSAGGRVLELGCGTGRTLLPIASAGIDIVGVDPSEHMLAKCREKLSAQSQEVQDRVRLVHGNMIDFQLDEVFTLIIIPFRPFQHLLEVKDQVSCLQCVYDNLNYVGRLVFDVFQVDLQKIVDPQKGEEVEDLPEFELPDRRKLRRCNRIIGHDFSKQSINIEQIYYLTDTDGCTKRLVHEFFFRYFFRYEIEHLLVRTGFQLNEVFGDFDRSPLRENSPEMIFVAEKM